MKILNNPELYLKGTCTVTVKRPSDGQIVFQSSKVATNNFTTEVDMSPVRAGLGNTIAIQLPSNSAVNLDLTTADFSLAARAMQVGSSVVYNAIVPVCETITASGSSLSLTGANPVACYGDGDKYAYVNFAGATDPGKAYTIGQGNAIEGFTAVEGTAYNVIYYERRADSQELGISGMFAPGVYTVSAQMAVFSTEGANEGNRGTQVGWAYYYIPRMQFSGNAGINGSQSENASSALSGTALSYEDAAQNNSCVDCNFPMLAYVTYVPLTMNGNNAIVGMTVVGGNITIAKDDSMVIPVKYVMADNTLAQPKFSDLTITSAATSTASVSGGVLTGVAAGSTTLTIEGPTAADLDAITVGVTVTA